MVYLITLAQLDVGSDKKFSIELTAGGGLMRDTGTWIFVPEIFLNPSYPVTSPLF